MNFGIGSAFFIGLGTAFSEGPGLGPGPLYKVCPNLHCYLILNSRAAVFCKKDVLKNFAEFTEKYLCQSLFFNTVAGLKLWHRCFPVNFAKFLKAPSDNCFC